MKCTRVFCFFAALVMLGALVSCGKPAVPGAAGTIAQPIHTLEKPTSPSGETEQATDAAAKDATERDASSAASANSAAGANGNHAATCRASTC
jgi:hypothetical protein